MKKFTKILALVLAAMMILSFVACNNEEPKDDPKDDPCTEHVDADKNGKCDKCDATVEVTPPACTEHTDANTDGKCDTCGATVEVTPPECTEHTDANTDGKCDTCGATVEVTPPECEHVDADNNFACDNCGADVSPEDEPLIFDPTVDGLSSTNVVYDWASDGISLDFTDSAIERVWTSQTDADVKAILEAGDVYYDHVLKLKGKGTFDLPGLVAAKDAALFTKGYTYSIEVNYYAKTLAGATYVIAYNGTAGNREVVASAFAAGENTLKFDYTVGEGETGLTFFTTEDVEIYIGEVSISLYIGGPSYNQLVNGYTFDMNALAGLGLKDDKGEDLMKFVKVGDVEDAEQKAGLIAAGLSEDTYVNVASWIAFPFHASHFVPGYKYLVKVNYVNFGSAQGYFIALDATGRNHTVTSGVFGSGGTLMSKEFTWEVGDTGEHTPIWYQAPSGCYIVSVEIKLDTSYDPHVSRDDVHTLTEEELAAGYKYDFTENNIPFKNNKIWVDIDDPNLNGSLSSILTEDKGFTSGWAYHVDGTAGRFVGMVDCFTVGQTYKITVRAYSEGSVFVGLLVLPFNADGNQCGGAMTPTATEVEGLENVWDITYEFEATAEISYPGFYINAQVDELYIAYIEIAPVTAAAE